MATIRKWLDEAGFDWATGKIVCQQATVGSAMQPHSVEDGQVVAHNALILDEEFVASRRGSGSPRFVARDWRAVYFPVQYDGSTWIERVVLDLDWYTKDRHKTPYPGI